MRKSRRKALIRIVQWVALVVVALDAAVYWAGVRPLQRLVAEELQAKALAQDRVVEEALRVERLKKFQAALPDADDEVKAFLRDHVPSRQRGFSRAARLVRRLSEESGLQLGHATYRLSASTGDPLEHLGIDVTVEGPFRGLIKFAHGMETGSDFILLRDFTFQPADDGNIALRLGADLYLEP